MAKEKKPENDKQKQFSRRDFLVAGGAVIASAVLFQSLGCSQKTTTTTSTSTKVLKTLKIGGVFTLGTDVGVDAQKSIKLLVDEDNNNGGLNIGGEQYKIDFISYDSQNSQDGEVAATNRLIYEDNVKYIITQGVFEAAWLPTTEQNKIIVMSIDPNAQVDLAAKTRYSFNPTFEDLEIPAKIGWFCKNYAELAKNMVIAFVDSQLGHIISMLASAEFQAFGVKPTVIFFPGNMQDLSAVATKIRSLNPGTVMVMTLALSTDAIGFNGVYQGGYRGQFFSPTNNPTSTWLQLVTPELLEGFITGMYPTEPDPALTPTAQHFKELWTAKYGSWTNPNIINTPGYNCLKAAWAKAGSLDVEIVTDTIASGLEYLSPLGDGRMVSRLDLGNSRTVDSVSTYYLKVIRGGKSELLTTIKPDEAINYMNTAFPPLPSGATSGAPGGPPTSP